MLGTDKIESILEDVKELVIVAKLVKEDGKVDLADLPHVISLLPKLGKFVEDFKAIGEAFEEGKDISIEEIIHLIKVVNESIKEIEKN